MATQTTTLRGLQNGGQKTMMNSRPTQPTTSAPQAMPIQARPYKDFLTPALHRRFTRAAGLILVLCWLEAWIMSRGAGFFWSWFPISATGLRALLLFMPCLAVFIIRVANMHAGRPTTTSGFETFANHVTSFQSLAKLLWYIYSAWFFGEVYIWAQGQDAGLGWVDLGKSYERPRVNENPVMLRWLFVWVAVVQVVLHLARNLDTIRVTDKDVEAQQQSGEEKQDQLAKYVPKAVLDLSAQWKHMVNRTLLLTTAGIVAGGVPTYYLFVRRRAWAMAYSIGRIFFQQLPASAAPHGIIHLGTFIRQAFTSVGMLIFLWEVSNAIFTVYVSESPLKRGQPLTNEIKDAHGVTISKSTDPNGSLIRGFKVKKDVPKTFAFWELYIICTDFPSRRKTFFTEVDRKDRAGQPDSTWSQVTKLCLAEITAISSRIVKSQQPVNAQPGQQQQQGQAAQQQANAFNLPKISDKQVQDGNVFQQRNQTDLAHTVGNLAKSFGQSPGAVNPFAPRAKKALEYAADRSVSKDTQERWRRDGLGKEAKGYMTQFLQTPLGEPFRQTFARRVAVVILGVPYSNKVNIIHAARSLARLAVCSLKEDDYGQAQKDISLIVRTFTATINDINAFVAGLAPSWTDVMFDEQRDRKVSGEVEEVREVLKGCLEEVVLAFGEYASALGLSQKEVRMAREAVGNGGREMVQTRT